MGAQSNAPIIIKKVKKVSGGGHHGGAWKVAYADFVTAMMAFFMLMWLLNATTEKQRKGIADYFSPTIPVVRISGGGDGSFGGDSVFSEETLSQNGNGGVPPAPPGPRYLDEEGGSASKGDGAAAIAIEAIQEALSGNSGESMVSDLARRHILTRVTDEGLLIELFDLENEPLFEADATAPEPVMIELAEMMVQLFGLVQSGVAIGGHVQSQPVVLAENTAWGLSAGRADTVRRLLETGGLAQTRVKRVTGYADRKPRLHNPMAARNNRIELILLRSDV